MTRFYIASMDRKRSDGRRDAGRPLATLFYRDYIVSNAWEFRKAQYYQRHAKACKICGATTNVQLNHIKYGNYGQEKDKDLVPLCGNHHQALHDKIGVRKDMHYQTEYFLADMIAAWDAEHEGVPQELATRAAPQKTSVSIAVILDRMARPIWALINIILGRS